MVKTSPPSLYDAVRVVRFPDGTSEAPVYYSQTGRSLLKVGDVGVVIGNWLSNKLRVEAVNPSGAIEWQDHLAIDQLETIPTTEGPYCRRRINEAWSWRLALNGRTIDRESHEASLDFARKVMAFARRNVETIVARLTATGHRFASEHAFVPPGNDVSAVLNELAASGVGLPIALQAWILEVGSVDLRGSHPDWPRSAYVGLFDKDSSDSEYWYTDPLVIEVDLQSLLDWVSDAKHVDSLDLAPDAITKTNFSGGGPISIDCLQPSFDNVLIGQHGSLTLFSYLKHAFDWAGFPGFSFTPDVPNEWLESMTRGLVRL